MGAANHAVILYSSNYIQPLNVEEIDRIDLVAACERLAKKCAGIGWTGPKPAFYSLADIVARVVDDEQIIAQAAVDELAAPVVPSRGSISLSLSSPTSVSVASDPRRFSTVLRRLEAKVNVSPSASLAALGPVPVPASRLTLTPCADAL